MLLFLLLFFGRGRSLSSAAGNGYGDFISLSDLSKKNQLSEFLKAERAVCPFPILRGEKNSLIDVLKFGLKNSKNNASICLAKTIAYTTNSEK